MAVSIRIGAKLHIAPVTLDLTANPMIPARICFVRFLQHS